jgi:D-alanyl-D-alanine endopeptidase (penicillin-binding protein 7)
MRRRPLFLTTLATFLLSFAWTSEAARARGVPDLTREGLPNVQSASALVYDLASGEVLYERDADTVRPIASVSKLVGSLVIAEECKLDPNGLHEMTKQNRDAARGGDKSKLTTGWKYSHDDILHAALMRSDNRALPALGEACGMDPLTFGEKMTARVRKMGLIRTTFHEPNGLSSENVSTARELGVVLKEVIKVPALQAIMSTKDYTITGYNKAGRAYPIKIKNTDRLLAKSLAEIIGGKTGYTDIARYCFAVAARTFKGREIGMVFLGGEGKHTRFADFTRVIKWLSPEAQLAKGDTPKVGASAKAAADVRSAPSAPTTSVSAAGLAPGGGASAVSEGPAQDTDGAENASW